MFPALQNIFAIVSEVLAALKAAGVTPANIAAAIAAYQAGGVAGLEAYILGLFTTPSTPAAVPADINTALTKLKAA